MKLHRPRLRTLIIAASVVALFTITGFLIAPRIVKTQLEKRASAELGRRVTVEKVKLNPYALSLTLENLAVQEENGTERFLGWNRLYVNFDALASLFGEWVLSEVELDGFGARVAINPDQSFNFSDILTRLAAAAEKPSEKTAKPAGAPRPIRVANLKVTQAQLAFADGSRKQPFATTMGPVTFSLTEFRTVSERGAPYRFEAVTEAAERLAWTGSLQIDPLRSNGEFAVENIVLAKYAPYYADQIDADIADGTLSVRGEYEFSQAPDQSVMLLKNGSVGILGLKLVERATKEVAVEIPEFSVTGIAADAATLKASIAAVAVNGGSIRARREKDGSINLLTMLMPKSESEESTSAPAVAPAPSTAPAARPEVTVADVSFKDVRVDVTDLAAPRPAQHGLSNIQASLKNVTLVEGAQIPVQLSLDWAPKGTVRLDGSVVLSPLQADLKVDVADLELLPLSAYLEEFVNARLTQGALSAGLQAQVQVPAGGQPVANVSGDVRLDTLGLVDSAHNEELVGFGALSLRGIRASSGAETSVSLEEVNIAAPFARILVNADKTMNVATVMKAAPTGETAAKPAGASVTAVAQEAPAAAAATPEVATAPTAVPPRIEIGKIVISDGDFRFSDRSVQPNVRMAISEFGGTIGALSSTQPAKGDVNLKAVVDGAGPIAIVGRLDPLSAKPTVDLKVDFKNVDLLPLSPYSGRFAGYELARGKLLLDVKMLVDGSKIDSTNVMTLNQFTFGNAVQSPEATKLPVRLGVALLKDLDGKIVIDLPVQGDLGDPSFRIGRVVTRVIVNLLTKAAVSPFTLLGAAFGGGGDELAFQEFAPGSSELQESERTKLATMINALTNRPGLSLGLEGSYDTAADAYALKRVKLADQVRRAIWENKRQANPNIPPPAELVITPEENVAMIKKIFDEKFPPGTEFGTPIPQAPAVIAPPPPPRGNLFQRFVRFVTMKAKREQRAAEKENARLTAEHAKAVEAAKAAGLPLEDMTARLAEVIVVDDNDLRALADARAQRVRDYFATTGHIAGERLYLTQAKAAAAPSAATAAAPQQNTGKGPRVFLTLQ